MPKRNRNGAGSIVYEPERKKYRAYITDALGKRISKRFDSSDEADMWLSQIKLDLYNNTYIPKSNITVGEWILEYLSTYCAPNIRAKTLIRYMQTARHLEPISGILLQELDARQVQYFYNNLPKMSDSSKNKIHKLLKAAITKAHILELVKKNIMNAIPAPKVSKPKIEIFKREELQAISDVLKTNSTYRRYYLLFLLTINTGMRLGEVLGLKRKCVFDDYVVINNSLQDINGKMVDTPPKTAAGEREITITRDLSSDLKKRFNSGKIVSFDGYIFQSKNGTPLRPNQIERAWKSILLLASVPHKKFHVLRHTHATQLLANGVPLLEVSKRLGHSRASHTLDLYGHAIPGYDASLPNKISKIFNL